MAKQTFTSGQVLTAQQVNDLQSNDFNQTVSTKTAAYTFVVGDRGTRVVLNDTTDRTFTINNSIFSAGDTLWVHNINTGKLTLAAGAGVTLNSASGLVLTQWEGGLVYFTSASSVIFFRSGRLYGVATGGSSSTITDGGFSWTLLSFTTDGTLTVSAPGIFECLLIGGGGGSGHNDVGATESTGGGGGGSVHITSLYLAAGTYTVDVGAGGAGSVGGTSPLANGSQSSIYNSTTTTSLALAEGGSGGADSWAAPQTGPLNIGGGSWRSGYSPTASVSSQSPLCFAGGAAFSSSGNGAGGGAGAAGNGSAGTATAGGAGGAGRSTTFTGASVTYGSGGAGGGNAAGATGSAIGGGGGGRQNGTTGNGTAGNAGAVYVRFR